MNEDIKIQKHKVIAQTWAKRKEFKDKGRLSISFHESHTDPVGLNVDVNENSIGTNEISSTFAQYLARITDRRGALTVATTNSSSCEPRKSSLDSQISVSVHHISVESRRTSVDSQVSVKVAKVTKKARLTCATFKGNKKRFNRRESSTSVESQVITSYPSSFAYSRKENHKDKRMKRRSANVGLTGTDDINSLIANRQLLMPFLNNQGMTTTSDDDNISRTSLKIQDSRLIVRQQQQHHHHHQHNGIINRSDDEFINTNLAAGETSDVASELAQIMYPGMDENPLKNSKEGGRSQRSNRSRKSSRQSTTRRNRKKLKNIVKVMTKRELSSEQKHEQQQTQFSGLDDSSFVSYSSDSLPGICLPTGVQSSFSGVSISKTHSRSSKTSCDVGTQANAFEIATQTMSFDDDNNYLKAAICSTKQFSSGERLPTNGHENALNNNGDDDDDDDDDHHHRDECITENHSLLPMPMAVPKKRDASLICRRDTLAMSESEKLKLLLLPSK